MPPVKDILPSTDEDYDRARGGGGRGGMRGAGRSDRTGQFPRSTKGGERNAKGRGAISASSATALAQLQTNENRWLRPTKEADDKQQLTRKLQSILNKLTPDKFEYFYEKLKGEVKAEALDLFIQLIFDKAISEQRYCVTYAQLCKKFSELFGDFRKSLLNRCQLSFNNRPVAPAVPASDASPEEKNEWEEKTVRIRAENLGIIMFIGELYKLKMLQDKIIIYCLNTLLSRQIEDYCTLMNSVGKNLEEKSPKEIAKMLERAFTETAAHHISPKVRFAVLETVELRKRNWVPRREVTGPKTIQEVHEDIQKKKEEKEKKQIELDKKQQARSPMNSPRSHGFSAPKSAMSRGPLTPSEKKPTINTNDWQQASTGKRKNRAANTSAKSPNRDGKLKNNFGLLLEEEDQLPQKQSSTAPKQSTSSVTAPPVDIEKKSETLIEDYFKSQNPDDVYDFVKEYSDAIETVVQKLIISTLEIGEKARKPSKELFLGLLKKSPKRNLHGAFNNVFEFLPELIIDSPLCPGLFGDFVGIAIEGQFLEETYLNSPHILTKDMIQKGVTGQIVGAAVKAFLLNGTSFTQQFCSKHKINFSNYLKPGQTEEKFLLQYGLTPLHPGYHCKSEISDLIEEEEADTGLISWIEQHCSKEIAADPSFIRYIVGAVLKQFRELNTYTVKEPSEQQQEKERNYIEQYAAIFQKFTPKKDRTHILNEVYAFVKEPPVWPGILGRLLESFISSEIVELDDVKQWRDTNQQTDEALTSVDPLFN